MSVWAKEQDRFRAAASQDQLVAWHRAGGGVYERFYHLFVAGELEALVATLPGVALASSGFERDNWYAIIERTGWLIWKARCRRLR